MRNGDNVNIAITGAGAGIGFDAVRIISTYDGIGELIACNVTPDCPARALATDYVQLPDFYFGKTSTEDDFIAYLLEIARNRSIDVIIPSSIFELQCLARNVSLFEDMGTRVIIEDLHVVQTFQDKLATAIAIRNAGGYSPSTFDIVDRAGISEKPPLPYPFLIKPRYGYGSKAISLIHSDAEFSSWDTAKPVKYYPYVAQEYLPSEDQEYTCSVLYDREGKPMSAKAILRNSMNGITMAATYNKECHLIEEYLLSELAPNIQGKYCLNMQFRIEDGKPSIFEVNPRFAASEPLRRIFGQDPYYAILSQYYPIMADVPVMKYGQAMRVYTEVFLPDKEA